MVLFRAGSWRDKLDSIEPSTKWALQRNGWRDRVVKERESSRSCLQILLSGTKD